MGGFLLDASAFAKTVLLEPGSHYVEELVSGAVAGPTTLVVLQIGFAEAVNAIWKRQQRGEIGPQQALEAHSRLVGLSEGLTLAEGLEYSRRSLEIAMAMNIAIYDALGVACAEAEGLTLVTGDRRQAEVAARLSPPVNVELFTPANHSGV
ncbi:MAG: type II toxin-antitoxin system VapC family toxin [Armatimonadota bacterium]